MLPRVRKLLLLLSFWNQALTIGYDAPGDGDGGGCCAGVSGLRVHHSHQYTGRETAEHLKDMK